MSLGHLVVLPDDRPEAGAGHLARSLALAQAWIGRGGTAEAPSSDLPPMWAERYRAAGLGPRDELPAWTLLDDYRAETSVQRRWRAAASGRLAVIDDHGSLAPYDADLVIDQNIGAVVAPPSAAGCSYTMLRPEFSARRGDGRQIADHAHSVLVSLGGSPCAATTARMQTVIDLLVERGFAVDVLSGATDVADRMLAADVALAASGSTAYELACTGTPSVLFAVAANQEPVGRRLADARAARYLGLLDDLDPGRIARAVHALADDVHARRTYSSIGRRLVDGRGAERVVARLRSLQLSVSDATPDDATRYWNWANDRAVRDASFHPDPIPWEEHLAWFTARIGCPDVLLLVAHGVDDVPIGQVRFDREGDEATIDYSLDAGIRGSGLGAPLLLAGLDELRRRWPGVRAVGVVRAGNVASRRAFELAGFEEEPVTPDARERSDALRFAAAA